MVATTVTIVTIRTESISPLKTHENSNEPDFNQVNKCTEALCFSTSNSIKTLMAKIADKAIKTQVITCEILSLLFRASLCSDRPVFQALRDKIPEIKLPINGKNIAAKYISSLSPHRTNIINSNTATITKIDN